jgi:cytochrome c oxidase assembly protein Cox11
MSETSTRTEQKARRANTSVAMGAAMMAISMVGVAYAAVPLYD